MLGLDVQRASHSPVLDALGSLRLYKAHCAQNGPPPPRVESVHWVNAPPGALALAPLPPVPFLFSAITDPPKDANHPPQLTLPWHRDNLISLLRWFKRVNAAADSALAFAPSLSKSERGLVHKQAQAAGLFTFSRGAEPDRYISVLAAGSSAHHPNPRGRPVELVYLWAGHGQAEAEAVAGISLDELAERAKTGNLPPEVRALLETARRVTASVYSDWDCTAGGNVTNGRGGAAAGGRFRRGGCGAEAATQIADGGDGGAGTHTGDGGAAGGVQRWQTAPDVAVGWGEAARAQRRYRCLTELRRGGVF
jgi:hypothetical protein